MKQSFVVRLLLALAVASLAQAHFVFVVPQPNGAAANIFISETLKPDPAVDAALVSGAKLSLRAPGGQETSLAVAKSGTVYAAPLSGSGTRVIHGLADIGVSGTAEKPYLLLYHPKTILGDAFDPKATLGASVPVELIPQGKPGAMTFKLVARGKPLADAEVTVILPDGNQKVVKTDSLGQTEVFRMTGRYGAWARFWETSAGGERDGKKYNETHHYATLVADAGDLSKDSAELSANSPRFVNSPLFANLPQATASFGSVASDGWLYVYGGHISPTHTYFVEAVSGRFDRMRLTGEPVWEQLPAGPGMQGMNLAAYKGKIYRVGGMTPLNKRGEPSDNHSIADVARYDPATKKWETLPSLPEARSSHDVVVIGDHLYVAGGWNMNGKDKGEVWASTVLVMDLSATTPAWSSIPQPFHRRALMAAAFAGKLYVIGGINDDEEVEQTVSIYDPETKQWSDGAPLPEGSMLGFSPAVGVHQGRLFVSVANGSLLRLNPAGTAWDKAGSSTPRVAHRLASRGDTVLVIGGAANGQNSDLIEAVAVGR